MSSRAHSDFSSHEYPNRANDVGPSQRLIIDVTKKLASCELLLLDDFGIKPLAPQQYQDLYDILDERSGGKSTIVTTQLPPEDWGEVIGDPITREAVTDRLVSRATSIHMKGGSYRKRITSHGSK